MGKGGKGVCEIGGGVGKEGREIREGLGKVREVGYIGGEVGLGEEEKKRKKGI